MCGCVYLLQQVNSSGEGGGGVERFKTGTKASERETGGVQPPPIVPLYSVCYSASTHLDVVGQSCLAGQLVSYVVNWKGIIQHCNHF